MAARMQAVEREPARCKSRQESGPVRATRFAYKPLHSFRGQWSAASIAVRASERSLAVRLLEDSFLSPQVAERSDIRDRKRHAKLILRAHLSQRDTPVLQRNSAAVSVVGNLRDLVLQRTVLNVVAHATREVESFAVESPVSHQSANLIRKRLQNRVILNMKVRHSRKEFTVRLYFHQRAFRHNLAQLRIVIDNLLRVILCARGDFQVAYNRR